MKLFARITKIDEAKREVWGRVAEEVLDNAGEIFDYATSAPYIKQWSGDFEKITGGRSLGNIRAMHGNVAAGKAIAVICDDAAKTFDIGTKIVDDNEWQKCLEGVYTGFSLGGKYIKKWTDPADARHTGYTGRPGEVSLVDKPCGPTSLFDVIKADGTTLQKKFKTPEDAVEELAELLKGGKISPQRLVELAKAETMDGEEIDPDEITDDDRPDDCSPEDWDAMSPDEKAQAVADSIDAGAEKVDETKARINALEKRSPKLHALVLRKREFSQKQRDAAADSGAALPDGSFPIKNAEDVRNAVKLCGNAKDPAAAKAHIIKRAKALGAEAELPEDWGKIDSAGDMQKRFDAAIRVITACCDEIAVCRKLADPALPTAELDALVLKALGPDTIAKIDFSGGKGIVATLREAALAKYGARNSASDAVNLQKAHDAIVSCGAMCAMPQDTGNADVGITDTLKGDGAGDLRKIIGAQTDTIAGLTKRLEEIEKQPVPRKGRLMVVGKGQDIAGGDTDADDKGAIAQPGEHNPEAALALMKAAVLQGYGDRLRKN